MMFFWISILYYSLRSVDSQLSFISPTDFYRQRLKDRWFTDNSDFLLLFFFYAFKVQFLDFFRGKSQKFMLFFGANCTKWKVFRI